MRKMALMLGLALVSCGGGEGGEDDAATDGTADTADTAGDTAETVADTATDTPDEVECASDGDCDDADPCTADRCDLDYDECAHDPVDADGDGYAASSVSGTECTGGTDCLDDLATAYPGAPIVECSGLDNDCNGHADQDDDGDGHVSYLCASGDDCDDTDAVVLVGECAGVNDCCDGCWQRNGCWLDPTTDLMWEDPPSEGIMTWDSAVSYCAALSLAVHGAGEWRLPTISELRTLVRGCPATEDGGACGVTDACLDDPCNHDCGCGSVMGGPGADGCYWDPALEGGCSYYWSSSSHAADPSYAWGVGFYYAVVHVDCKDDYDSVRCVRPGP